MTHDHLEDHDPEHHEDGSRDVDQGRPARDRFNVPTLGARLLTHHGSSVLVPLTGGTFGTWHVSQRPDLTKVAEKRRSTRHDNGAGPSGPAPLSDNYLNVTSVASVVMRVPLVPAMISAGPRARR